MRGPAWETFLAQPLEIGDGLTLTASAVSMGNPHLVVFVDGDPATVHVGHIGPALERHELFPERTNVEFAYVHDGVVHARVWERGSGETMACGSGACAAAIAANEAGLVPTRAVVRFPGGDLEVERRPDGEVLLPAKRARVRGGRRRRGADPLVSVNAPAGSSLHDRLGERTLALVDVPSVSRDEGAMLGSIRSSLPSSFEVLDDHDAVLFATPAVRRVGRPFVVLAGHVDTVPITRNVPGSARLRRRGRTWRGRHEGRARRDAGARRRAGRRSGSPYDVGVLFFGREELPITESALGPLFDRCAAASTPDLAIVMEPTANTIEVGCLGNLNATVIVTGRAAHSARPWHGENAIHRAIAALAPLAELPVRDVKVEGLTFREVVSVTTISGGVASNVVPDRVEAAGELPLPAGAHPRGGRGATPGAAGALGGRGPRERERAARAGQREQPPGVATPRSRRSCPRPEAGLDAGRGVRPGRCGRRQLRSR